LNFSAKVYYNAIVTVPDVALEAYKSADGWKNFWNYETYSSVNNVTKDSISYSISDNTINFNGSGNCKIYNTSGKQIYSGSANGSIRVSHGIYIIVANNTATKVAVK
jgi:hypothetical protein